jgi:hypothetical protein
VDRRIVLLENRVFRHDDRTIDYVKNEISIFLAIHMRRAVNEVVRSLTVDVPPDHDRLSPALHGGLRAFGIIEFVFLALNASLAIGGCTNRRPVSPENASPVFFLEVLMGSCPLQTFLLVSFGDERFLGCDSRFESRVLTSVTAEKVIGMLEEIYLTKSRLGSLRSDVSVLISRRTRLSVRSSIIHPLPQFGLFR